MTDDLIVIESGDWLVKIAPALGGQIIQADWRRHHVLAPCQPGRAAPEQHAGCFPLVPFSNRIRDGRFVFEGREVILPPPDYAAPHALHGRGWRDAWTVQEVSDRSVRITLSHERGAWPWRYAAHQVVSVNGDALRLELSLTNLDDAPMPGGIGLHPYFTRPVGFWLKARTEGRWATRPGEPGLPLQREPAPADLGAAGLDHCFHGWEGRAEFGGQGGLHLTLTASETLRNLVIYTPPGEDYFCAEPVSHVNDAVNQDGLAKEEQMAVLAPLETLSGSLTIAARLA